MMEYTKGPWEWVQYHDAHTALIRTANLNPGDKRTVLYHAAEWEMLPADKSIIAAAPDMYEALKMVGDYLETDAKTFAHDHDDMLQIIYNVIATAEGGQD